MFDDTVVVVRPGETTNRAGDTVPDWSDSAVTRASASDVNVQPLSQAETVELGRDVTVTLWRLISARGVDVDLTEHDRVEWSGVDKPLAVVGKPARYTFGGVHVEAVLQLAEG